MASMKKQARASSSSGSGSKESSQAATKEHTNYDGVLELSMTIGYLGADVSPDELQKVELLMAEHCVARVASIERGDLESHLHFQMVVRTRVPSTRAFGVLCRKYMGWHGRRNMTPSPAPSGRVTCKVLTNRLIHTFKGMIGYCLKDTGAPHFAVAMHNVTDDDVIAGKTLHAIYGRADLKRRVTLTNKNVTERMYVWYKYRESRQLTTTFLSTLTEMIKSGMFMPSASWIIPMSGQGMELWRMKSLWRCVIDPSNVDKDIVADVFICKRDFVHGMYHRSEEEDDDSIPDSFISEEEESIVLKSCLKSVRFEAKADPSPLPCKKPQFTNSLGTFIPLYDPAPLMTDEFLPTTDVLVGQNQTVVKTEPEFWDSLTVNPSTSLLANRKRAAKGKAKVEEGVELICLSSDEEPNMPPPARRRRLLKIAEIDG